MSVPKPKSRIASNLPQVGIGKVLMKKEKNVKTIHRTCVIKGRAGYLNFLYKPKFRVSNFSQLRK
jgi:hypothetical protein